jgi:hypothetical protein
VTCVLQLSAKSKFRHQLTCRQVDGLHGWTISDVGQAAGFGWTMDAYLDQKFSLITGGHTKNYLTFAAYSRDFGWTCTLPNTVLSGVLMH